MAIFHCSYDDLYTLLVKEGTEVDKIIPSSLNAKENSIRVITNSLS